MQVSLGKLVFHPSPQTPAQPRTTFLSHCYIRVVSDQSTVLKCSVDRLNTTYKLLIVQKRDPERDPRVTFFLLFFPSLRLCSARRILKSDWVNLTFAALRLTFIRGHEGFLKFHADRVIIGLPCGQGQLSRIWKVQRDWLSVGKECCPRLSRRLWGGTKHELP